MKNDVLSKSAKLLLCSALFSAFTSIVPQSAIAADATDTTAGAAPATTTLQGNVVQIATTLNTLRDARLSISRVRKAAANLYDEVNRQQVSMTYNPNMIGTTVIMTPTPTFTGVMLPPRDRWVKASISEMGPIINLFKEDVDLAIESNRQTDVNDSTRAAMAPLREEAFKSVEASFATYKQLEQLTSGRSYDNSMISATVKTLDKEMKTLDKSLKKGISILQKAGKSKKA